MTETGRELRRVLQALALELPPSVHADASARILALFEREKGWSDHPSIEE